MHFLTNQKTKLVKHVVMIQAKQECLLSKISCNRKTHL